MIFSLAIGMFCFIISSLFIDYEYSRNTNHVHAKNVHRVMLKMQQEGRKTYLPNPFSSEIINKHPEVEAISSFDGTRNDLYLSVNGEEYITEKSGYYADEGFFQVFTFPLKYGDPKTALSSISNVVISERLAKILFKDEMPIGKDLMVYKKGTFRITGVLEKVPVRSLMNPEILFSRDLLFKEQPRRKNSSAIFTYMKVSEQTDLEGLKKNLFVSFKQMYPEIDVFTGIFTERLDKAYWGNSSWDYSNGAQYSSFFGADRQMINVVKYTSYGIIICAILGFLSLSLGLAIKRAKEIGVRKMNGAVRRDIQIQVLSESVIYTYVAFLISIIAVEISSGYFSELFGVPIGLNHTDLAFLVKLFVFVTIVGLIAGLYPAIVISNLNPVRVLLGFNSQRGSGFRINRVLLTVQLSATIILLFGMVVQTRQVQKLSDFNLGYNKENLLAFTFDKETNLRTHDLEIIEEVKSMDGVIDVSGGPFPFTFNGYHDFKFQNGDTIIRDEFALVKVHPNFFQLMGIEIVMGNDFRTEEVNTSEVIINEALAKVLGEDVLGSMVEVNGKLNQVVGIAKDYTDWGLSSPKADPRIFTVDNGYHSILVKHDGTNTSKLIEQLETQWRKYEAVLSPSITNMSAEEDSLTLRVGKSMKLTSFLSLMVLTLSLLNLFGYAVMYGNSKVKNISIRKVLGAEAKELFLRLIKPFFNAFLLCVIVGLPLAYWLMERYLNDFAIRVELSFVDGLIAAIMVFVSILLVTGTQMLRVSRINPVSILKE